MVGVAAGVQDLHGDLAAGSMHGVGDEAVFDHLPLVLQRRCAGHHDPILVRGNAAGDDQADAAARALGVEGGETAETLRRLFETGVHRTHQDTIPERREAEVERGEQMGIGVPVHAGNLLGQVVEGWAIKV
ncbi:MAG: hypothetical protein FAZ92_03167 [Accumulibacter sp.]|nr:MAG: hypothetical protein FAZ92_03167 [Accumulibacter sp.]